MYKDYYNYRENKLQYSFQDIIIKCQNKYTNYEEFVKIKNKLYLDTPLSTKNRTVKKTTIEKYSRTNERGEKYFSIPLDKIEEILNEERNDFLKKENIYLLLTEHKKFTILKTKINYLFRIAYILNKYQNINSIITEKNNILYNILKKNIDFMYSNHKLSKNGTDFLSSKDITIKSIVPIYKKINTISLLQKKWKKMEKIQTVSCFIL